MTEPTAPAPVPDPVMLPVVTISSTTFRLCHVHATQTQTIEISYDLLPQVLNKTRIKSHFTTLAGVRWDLALEVDEAEVVYNLPD
jgi:hypothetical protein